MKIEKIPYMEGVHFSYIVKDILDDKIKHLMQYNVKIANFEAKIRKMFSLNILMMSFCFAFYCLNKFVYPNRETLKISAVRREEL